MGIKKNKVIKKDDRLVLLTLHGKMKESTEMAKKERKPSKWCIATHTHTDKCVCLYGNSSIVFRTICVCVCVSEFLPFYFSEYLGYTLATGT